MRMHADAQAHPPCLFRASRAPPHMRPRKGHTLPIKDVIETVEGEPAKTCP
jgi:hypothetical protein